jgi:homoserine O-acetyltransferase
MSAPAADGATRYFAVPELKLENGSTLRQVWVAYRTWGRLADDGANAVVVCHALTGDAHADRWWAPLFGAGHALDPEHDFVVCANVLGGCAGTTGPSSFRPGTAEPYGAGFPSFGVRDIVRLHERLVRGLGVRRVRLVLGGSLGGLQALEWGALFPDFVDAIAPIAASASHSPWTIAWSEAQRQAIYADSRWRDGCYRRDDPPRAGLAAARMMAMVSYRSAESFAGRFARRESAPSLFAVEGWLHHHGRALVERFDANTYVALTRAMDRHDVARGRGTLAQALGGIRAPALVVGVPSDVLYPLAEQRELASLLPAGRLAILDSPHGHDAFLLDAVALDGLLVAFRDELELAPPALREAAR